MVDPSGFLQPGSSSTGGRREACVSNGNVDIDAPGSGAELVNLTRSPDKLPYCIPICKRIRDELFFVDGTFIESNFTSPAEGGTDPEVYFGENQHTLNRYAADEGASQIGVDTTTSTGDSSDIRNVTAPIDLQTALQEILDGVNDKLSLGADETLTGGADKKITLDKVFVALRGDFGDAPWHLVYRNNGKTKNNTSADVGWETVSIYEQANTASPSGGYAIVIGGVLNSLTTVQASDTETSPPGPTPHNVLVRIMKGNTLYEMAALVAPSTVLSISNALDWDTYCRRESSGNITDHAVGTRTFSGDTTFEDDVDIDGELTTNDVVNANDKIIANGSGTLTPINLLPRAADPAGGDLDDGDLWITNKEVKAQTEGSLIHTLNICKAYCLAHVAGGVITIPYSFNVNVPACNFDVQKRLVIVYGTAMDDPDNYVVQLTPGGIAHLRTLQVGMKDANSVSVLCYDNTDTKVELDSTTMDIYVAVFGSLVS